MKSRLLICFAALTLLVSLLLPFGAFADSDDETTPETTAETTAETTSRYSMDKNGTCGKDLTWRLEDHTLIISGSGKMDAGSPWEFYKDTIHTLILDGPITTIGDEAFAYCNNLQYIDFGDSLVEIGTQAFYSCNAIEAVKLPASFRKFGSECFRDCENLEVIFCEGPMPSFKSSCLYNDHTVKVYYTNQTPWPAQEVERLMSNFGGRIYVTSGSEDVLDPYFEDMPDTTAVVPETTVPETTAETEPETVPTTAPTVPATTAETEPETTAAAAATEPQETAPVFALESEPIFVTEADEEEVPQTPIE
ncbi:MAG: leucine-rich repeat domain-containing protein, partial [Oscillospiraceae bacterium]|nr:leucine-rich repeat domain-containing protein [Oscillospiraceae bacterium]